VNSLAIDYPVVKFLNHVLADYPLARDLLKADSGKTIEATVGLASVRLRVSQNGDFELVGKTKSATDNVPDAAPEVPLLVTLGASPDVAFRIPANLLPRLASGDESAFSEVAFEGNSEFASTLSSIARNINWDVEEDLSQVIGDMAARRIVGSASATRLFIRDAESRLLANVAEYLTEEKRALTSKRELESVASENENLRDALARLEAKINAVLKSVDANVENQH
jgi:ubiquinone biosynthesis protein UbiJ